VKIGSSQEVILPDVISDILNFINVAPFCYPSTSAISFKSKLDLSEKQHGNELQQIIVTTDSPNKVEACFSTAVLPLLKKTNYCIELSNMRLLVVDVGSIDLRGPFISSMKALALTETIVAGENSGKI
jgi:hypothetical protein